MPADHPPTPSAWRKAVLQHRITVSLALALGCLWFIYPSRESLLLSLPLIMLGEAVRIWASGHIHKMVEVTTTGPYALCRHPLYLGHLLITTGFCVAGNNAWLALAVMPLFFVIFIPTMEQEETALADKFGQTYRDYMDETPRILPRWSTRVRQGGHDWQQVRKHREANNILGLVGALVLFAMVGLWRGSW
jgi:protein-S-isoprenylcysteine O-methyltransferase Ste14